MRHMLAEYTASISELKKNPSALISSANGAPIAVLNHNVPTAYLIPATTYERLVEAFDDAELRKIVARRLKHTDAAIEVDLESL